MTRAATLVVMLALSASAAVDARALARVGPKTQWAPTRNCSSLNAHPVFAVRTPAATSPYAGEAAKTAAAAKEAGFTGHRVESALGLSYAKRRWLDSSTGTWLSRDDVGAASYLQSPNELNPWQYAAGNPTRYTDPDGRDAAACIMKGLHVQDSTWGTDSADCQAPSNYRKIDIALRVRDAKGLAAVDAQKDLDSFRETDHFLRRYFGRPAAFATSFMASLSMSVAASAAGGVEAGPLMIAYDPGGFAKQLANGFGACRQAVTSPANWAANDVTAIDVECGAFLGGVGPVAKAGADRLLATNLARTTALSVRLRYGQMSVDSAEQAALARFAQGSGAGSVAVPLRNATSPLIPRNFTPSRRPTEAELRYAELAQMRERAGLPAFDPNDPASGTAASAYVDGSGTRKFGLNPSLAPSQQELKQLWFEAMQREEFFPAATNRGSGSAASIIHAEGNALIRAWMTHVRKTGQYPTELTIFSDRVTCDFCQDGLPQMMEFMGLRRLRVYSGGAATPMEFNR